ncbi:MAG: hypothetical protein QG568_393 [Patescibacteria group bacterium]|nr:hypothetical protein [Patescibacteria group bacterium]
MELSTQNKISLLKTALEKVDDFSTEFGSQIQNISNQHKTSGGHLEYAYVQHFHKEIIGLSKLFQYLLKDDFNQKYVFFAVRGSFEVIFYLEYVLRLAKEDSKKVLELLSRDMAQIGAALDVAIPPTEEHDMHKTLKAVGVVNKILKTDFDLTKIKSNTRVFPSIKDLCDKSSLNLKDLKGSAMYSIYALYSESNHLRLGNQHAITDDVDLLTCWALEYFLEIYIKFYQQLIDTKIFPEKYANGLASIKQSVGMNW